MFINWGFLTFPISIWITEFYGTHARIVNIYIYIYVGGCYTLLT